MPSTQLPDEEARRLALLALFSHEWIHRRVDQIDFLDRRTTLRRISVDFTVPRSAESKDAPVPWVPLLQLQKVKLLNFDLTDGNGTVLHMPTTIVNGDLSTQMLTARAEVEAPDFVDTITRRYIRVLVFASTDAERDQANERLFPDSAFGDALRGSAGFMSLARDLSENFFLYIDTSSFKVGKRCMVKLSFEAEEYGPKPGGFAERLGWRPVPHGLLAPRLGSAQSAHVEIRAPQELVLTDGRGLTARADDLQPVPPSVGVGRRTHFHVSRGGRGTTLLIVSLVAESSLIPAAFFASLLNAATIAFVYWRLPQLLRADSADAVVAAVLTVPGLISAYMARPSEHRVLSSFLVGTRVLASVSGLLSFAAGLCLFAGFENPRRIYLVLMIASIVVSALLARTALAQYKRSR